MRGISVIRHIAALLSQIFFISVLSMAFWAFLLCIITGWTPTVVMSDSMMPSVRTGDIAIASPMSKQEITEKAKIGHVLLAENPAKPGTLYTHRIVGMEDNNTVFITKGDANKAVDSTKLPIENVKGLERVLVPYIGIPFQAANKGNYLPFIVFFALMLFSFTMMRKEWQILRESESTQAGEEPVVPENMVPLKGKRGRRKLIRKKRFTGTMLTFTGMIAIVVIASFFLGFSFASFSAPTKNTGCTFQAKSSFATAPPVNSCWAGTSEYQDYTIYTTNHAANMPLQPPYTANAQVKLNPSGTGFTFKYQSPRYISGFWAQITFTNSSGANVVFRKQFTSTNYVEWINTTSQVGGSWVQYRVDITDNTTAKYVYYYYGTPLKVTRCV